MIESMPQEQLGPFCFQRKLSRKRFFRSVVDRDDRGWTPLHISARKGDLKAVIFFLSFFFITLFYFISFFVPLNLFNDIFFGLLYFLELIARWKLEERLRELWNIFFVFNTIAFNCIFSIKNESLCCN